MKNFLLIVMLVIATDRGVASNKFRRMPQIATVSLSKLAPLKPPDRASITKALAVLPSDFLNINCLYDDCKDRSKYSATGGVLAVLTGVGTAVAYTSSVYSTSDPSLLSNLAIITGMVVTPLFIRASIRNARGITKIIDAYKYVKIEGEATNELVIYEKDGEYQVGLLSFNDKDQHIVTDAHGNQETIGHEHLAQLLVIKDSFPFGFGFNKQGLMEATHTYADDYIGATLAFNHQGKNYLSTVTDVTFSLSEGMINITTSAGEKIQIRRGGTLHSKPVLVAPDSVHFNSGDEIRGVLFRQ